MSKPHDCFKALAPADWEDIDHDDLPSFLKDTFNNAQTLLDSIPTNLASSTDSKQAGRPRSQTDPALPHLPSRAPQSSEHAAALRKEWKEVKVNPRENPQSVNVYKLSSKDSKGAWFARRSVHKGLTFERWKLGMERELAETLKVQNGPGTGNIRGIGADKRVVKNVVKDCGKVEVYQLSAQFPGPTTPRDFITLLLSTDSAIETPIQDGLKPPRYFMLVSKPCIHPKCPPQNGFIRGQYESVEFIREIHVEKPLRKIRSSIDVIREDQPTDVNTAVSNEALGADKASSVTFAGADDDEEDDQESMIEWLMVTRSDPGGNVPRFMVERGTPGGIANDAGKFVNWITRKNLNELGSDDEDEFTEKLKKDAESSDKAHLEQQKSPTDPSTNIINDPAQRLTKPRNIQDTQDIREETSSVTSEAPQPSGFYNVIAGALGMASSVVASRLPNNPFGSTRGGDSEDESLATYSGGDDSSDISSIATFHSVASAHGAGSPKEDADGGPLGNTTTGTLSSHSQESKAKSTATSSQHDKELRKLEDRKRKLQEKMQRYQERASAKKQEDQSDKDKEKEAAALAKLREKHEKEIAKQEHKYQREIKKVENKQAQEKRKAEDRRKKQIEREEKQHLGMELENVRAERDVARKQIEMLKEQVGALQAQNTVLVARLGKEGLADKIDWEGLRSLKQGETMDGVGDKDVPGSAKKVVEEAGI